jgi:pyridoxine 5-phosphate synthase
MTIPRLGVNIDHVATLRNARGGAFPDPVAAAQLALQAGADGITLHLREDRRHITDDDLARMRAAITAPINLEMAATAEMVEIACRTAPHAACIVPEKRAEITTEGGLDAAAGFEALRPIVGRLTNAGIRVSLFLDPDPMQLKAAQELGAAVVELHTGAYAEGRASEFTRLEEAAALLSVLGLECHAGHGLTFANVQPVARLQNVRELNIGHYLIGEAIFIGLAASVTRMRDLIAKASLS